MREARYRFSEDVRSATRAIAVRMIHAGNVASSPEALEAWIARTDDLRETLTDGGYGSAFGADDLFPLFRAFVDKATTATPSRAPAARTRWVWLVSIVFVIAVVVGVIVTVMIAS